MADRDPRWPVERVGGGRRGQDTLAALVEGISDYAIFMLDRHGYVTSWNPGAERIKGYVSAEIIGQHVSIFYTEEDRRAGKPDRDLEMAASDGGYQEEAWRVRKDGSRFWASASLTPLWSESGKLRGFAKVTRDDTERRRAAEERRRLETIETQERLGRELHQEVVQRLFSVGLTLEGALTLTDRPEARTRIEAAVEEIDAVIRQIRTTLWSTGDQSAPAGSETDGGGLHILVVDDDPDMQALLPEFLRHLGEVYVVPDAYAAMNWLEGQQPDVMVLDLLLPGATGVDLLDRLRERGKRIPTVVVSGADPEDRLTALARDAGAAMVVTKPFDRRQLAFSVVEAARDEPE